MKFKLQITIVLLVLFSCSEKPKKDSANPLSKQGNNNTLTLYRNLDNQEILTRLEYDEFLSSLHLKYSDSISGSSYITIHHKRPITSRDTIIQPFSYDVRVGTEYKIRSREYKKIGMHISPRTFETVEVENSLSTNLMMNNPTQMYEVEDSIQIGGIQTKPTLINLWFIGCGGCVAEIPALNKLKEKYKNEVNFIAISFDAEANVKEFLKKTPFNFTHIANNYKKHKKNIIKSYLEYLGSYPYPENIFLDKTGKIRYIEGGMPNSGNLDNDISHFELIIRKLVKEK